MLNPADFPFVSSSGQQFTSVFLAYVVGTWTPKLWSVLKRGKFKAKIELEADLRGDRRDHKLED